MSDWHYQKDDAPARGSVVDFTGTIAPCPACGAEAYVQFTPYGRMLIRYRCEHEPEHDEDDDRVRAAFIAGYSSGWDDACEEDPRIRDDEAYERWREGM